MYLLGLTSSTEETTSSTVDLVVETQKRVNAFTRFWNSIDWDKLSLLLIEKALYIIAILVLFGFFYRLGKLVIKHTFQNYSKKTALSDSRLKTLQVLISNIYSYTLYFFLIYALLSTIGVPVGSLLAGAGIAGLAIGLGAQGFMNDIITGFFIIFEKQLDVGDYIKLLDLSIEGTVTAVGIRTTQLKSSDGTLHFIPNRNITTVSNLSRANMQVLIDVRIAASENMTAVSKIIATVNEELHAEMEDIIQTGPTIFGMVDLGNSNFAVRVTMYVANSQQYRVKAAFLARYVTALTEAGYPIPNTPIAVPAT